MEKSNAHIALVVLFVLVVLGVGAYAFYGTGEELPLVDSSSEVGLPEAVTDNASPKQSEAQTPPEAQEAQAVSRPVLSYSAGCTSASGVSATTGASCDGSAVLAIVTEPELPPAKSGQPYTVTIKTSGGPGTPVAYTWSVNSDDGTFPVPGLRLGAKYGNSVAIVGAPAEMYFSGVRATRPVTFTISLTATAGAQSATETFKLRVDPTALSAIAP
ncbi:MAG: hypothetical protein WC030_01715 [Candidatus Paceibacterota bacterium]